MNRHALIVDDDQDIVNLVAYHLNEQGFTVTTASNGSEALEQVRQSRPDLLILDIEMPKMNGLECLRQLRAELGTIHLPVILMTCRDDLPDMLEGWKAGADLYMTKPFEKQTLLQCVQHIFSTAEEEMEAE